MIFLSILCLVIAADFRLIPRSLACANYLEEILDDEAKRVIVLHPMQPC